MEERRLYKNTNPKIKRGKKIKEECKTQRSGYSIYSLWCAQRKVQYFNSVCSPALVYLWSRGYFIILFLPNVYLLGDSGQICFLGKNYNGRHLLLYSTKPK